MCYKLHFPFQMIQQLCLIPSARGTVASQPSCLQAPSLQSEALPSVFYPKNDILLPPTRHHMDSLQDHIGKPRASN